MLTFIMFLSAFSFWKQKGVIWNQILWQIRWAIELQRVIWGPKRSIIKLPDWFLCGSKAASKTNFQSKSAKNFPAMEASLE